VYTKTSDAGGHVDAVLAQDAAAFDHTPAGGLQGGIDMLGAGFGFVHARFRPGCASARPGAIKTRSTGSWGRCGAQLVDLFDNNMLAGATHTP